MVEGQHGREDQRRSRIKLAFHNRNAVFDIVSTGRRSDMQQLGHGIFSWSGDERRSDRYGSFILLDAPYGKAACLVPTYNLDLAQKLEGKRVRIVVKVIEPRMSGHAGDLFLGIFPSTPEAGEMVVLGVGIFSVQPDGQDEQINSTVLAPGDGREVFWIDPRKLYRLHDQTVDVWVEETTEAVSPAPNLKAGESGLKVVHLVVPS